MISDQSNYPNENHDSQDKAEEPKDNPFFFTGRLDEGFGHTEVVGDTESQYIIHNEDEEEIFTATPLKDLSSLLDVSYALRENVSSPSFTNQHRKQKYSVEHDIFIPWQTPGEPDTFSTGSESSQIEFNLLSDDETHLSLTSSVSFESDNQDQGNMPNFEQLDVVTTAFKSYFSPNPFISKRIPTATVTYLSAPSSPETSAESPNEEESQRSVTKSPIRSPDDDTTSKFCTTLVQSALLEKLTSDGKSGELKNVTSLSVPDVSLTSRQKAESTMTKSSRKKKRRVETVSLNLDESRDVEHLESDVGKAFKESVSEGSVMPLLKQELHYKIQVGRLERGEPELILEPEKPKKYEVSKEHYREN